MLGVKRLGMAYSFVAAPDESVSGPSSDMKAFREVFSKARNIVVLSGAGTSAESGVPTFRWEQ